MIVSPATPWCIGLQGLRPHDADRGKNRVSRHGAGAGSENMEAASLIFTRERRSMSGDQWRTCTTPDTPRG